MLIGLAVFAIASAFCGLATCSLSFRKDGRVTSVRVASHLAITIHEGATASAVAGLGMAASSESSARAELEPGQLVRMLPD